VQTQTSLQLLPVLSKSCVNVLPQSAPDSNWSPFKLVHIVTGMHTAVWCSKYCSWLGFSWNCVAATGQERWSHVAAAEWFDGYGGPVARHVILLEDVVKIFSTYVALTLSYF